MSPRRDKNDTKKVDQVPFSVIAPPFMQKPNVPISVITPRFMREPNVPISVEAPGQFNRQGRNLKGRKEPVMDQRRATKAIVDWINANLWKPNIKVRCGGRKADPNTPNAENCSLYMGPKLRGQGRTGQIAQVDILVEDGETKTVELMIEVEPVNEPKKILGEMLPALLAESYTPSILDGPLNERKIRDAVFLFVTVLPDNPKSQKPSQLNRLEQFIIERLEFKKLNVRSIKFCIGNTEEDAVHKCNEQIKAFFWNPPPRSMQAESGV
jgi:hypothetical protein